MGLLFCVDIVYTIWYSLSMRKNKRMIYIYDENVAKYDALENKAEWVNSHLKELPAVHIEPDENQVPLVNDFEEKIRSIRGRDESNIRAE